MEEITIGVKLIATERQKQIDKHGFTAKYHISHPEYYETHQLTIAAFTLLNEGIEYYPENKIYHPANWDRDWFIKLCRKSNIERLTIAGALIAAELDRLTELACYQKCESCQKEADIDIMKNDDDSNWFCPECWKELAPTMKADYEELKRNGEIE